MAKLIIGCGYLGRRVARRWHELGEPVYTLTRSADRAAEMARQGWQPIVGDVTRPETLVNLPEIDAVLYAVGFDRAAGPDMRTVYVDGLKNVLDALPASVTRLVYISSTSVYGQDDGGVVDESSPCEPAGENGRVCLAAERLLAEHRYGARAIVLRLAGIYGPGRIPRLESLRRGEPIPAEPDSYLNLIHVDDAAGIVLAAAESGLAPRLYTVCDGYPTTRRAFYEELARRAGTAPPTFDVTAQAQSPRQRAATNKRISNARLLTELPVELRYPTFREGLAAIVEQGG